MPLTYAVIIPTHNEEGALVKCLRSVRQSNPGCQMIVSDAASQDATLYVAAREGAVICRGSLGRGTQLNCGAQAANADVLVFLHADTILPEKAFDVLEQHFCRPEVKIGTFRLRFDYGHWFLRLCGYLTRFDSALTRFGDQGICVRSDFFQQMDGFPEWPLFEDVEFLRRARRITRIYSFPAEVVTSARKFKKNGPVRQQLQNGILLIKYLIGVSPEQLAREYR